MSISEITVLVKNFHNKRQEVELKHWLAFGADSFIIAFGELLGIIQGAGLCDGSDPQCLIMIVLKHPEILSL